LSEKIQQQIDWRRSKVLELKSRGMSQTEIASTLQVSKSLISLDMQFLREQAKAAINEYTTETLPEQYQIALAALDEVIKSAFYIYAKSEDYREKLAALELYQNGHLTKLELLSNSATIDSALQFIRSKQQQQQEETTSVSTTDGEQTVF
jgi:transposase